MKSHVDDAADSSSSSLNHLPDEIIFQILSKVVDLKTLCFCYLVCRRFSSIVLQVNTISLIAPRSDNNITGFRKLSSLINGVVFKPLHLLQHYFVGKSFRTAVSFSAMFTTLKSFTIELPTPRHKCIDNTRLFKWKISFSNEIESFIFLSPNSICDAKDDQHFVEEESMSSQYCIPVLNLPVSGYVMKGVILFVMRMNLGTGCFMNDEEGFEGKPEAVYSEAVTEILEIHSDEMARLRLYNLETGSSLVV